jgi:hypothetical protein
MNNDAPDQAHPGAERDRRAPVLAGCRLALQSAGFRTSHERMPAFADQRFDALQPDDRLRVHRLLRRLAAQWIGAHGPSHRALVAEVRVVDSTLRVDVFTDPPLDDPELWIALVESFEQGVATRWAIDRRRSSGVWFEYAGRT